MECRRNFRGHKTTDMVSVFKKGIKEALKNFGEVRIISISEKILEQIIM